MDRAGRFGFAEHVDRALDLPPVAEMDDVAERSAAVGADRRFALRVLAELGDQLGRLAERCPVLDMDMLVHAFPLGVVFPCTPH